MNAPDDLVVVGKIAGAYGIRGWIRVEPFGDADSMLQVTDWWLGSDDAWRAEEREEAKRHSGAIVAKFSAVSDRNQAELLKGQLIAISRKSFPVSASDEYYWVDLIGCAVFDGAGQLRGTVTGMSDNGAHSILQVQKCGASVSPEEAELIPFVAAYVLLVDVPGRRVVLDWDWAGEDAAL